MRLKNPRFLSLSARRLTDGAIVGACLGDNNWPIRSPCSEMDGPDARGAVTGFIDEPCTETFSDARPPLPG